MTRGGPEAPVTYQQKPEFESQPDLVLNAVTVLKCVENPIKKSLKMQ